MFAHMLPIEFLLLYPISLPVAFLMHKAWHKLSEAKPYDYSKQPDELPKWTPQNTVAKHASKELRKMYRGGQL